MKLALIIFVLVNVFGQIYLFIQAKISQSRTSPGLKDGLLSKCRLFSISGICSEFPKDKIHFFPPINIVSNENIIDHSISIIQEMGGTILDQNENYIAATFTTKFYKFVDDFELRVDTDTNTLHIRAAARVGEFDFFTNKKRAQEFSLRFSGAK